MTTHSPAQDPIQFIDGTVVLGFKEVMNAAVILPLKSTANPADRKNCSNESSQTSCARGKFLLNVTVSLLCRNSLLIVAARQHATPSVFCAMADLVT